MANVVKSTTPDEKRAHRWEVTAGASLCDIIATLTH